MRTITKSITVNAIADNVWHVFINPNVSRKMGGEYVSDWKAGGTIGWKGKDGQMYTTGTILAIEPGKKLKHDLRDLNDREKVLSVVSYEFKEDSGATAIYAEEILYYETSDSEFEDIASGWDYALEALKQIAETL